MIKDSFSSTELTNSTANARKILGDDGMELRVMLVRLRLRPGPSAVFHRVAVVTHKPTYVAIKGPQATSPLQAMEGLLEETRSMLASGEAENIRGSLLLDLTERTVSNTMIFPPPSALFPSDSGTFVFRKKLSDGRMARVWHHGEEDGSSTSRNGVEAGQVEDSQKH